MDAQITIRPLGDSALIVEFSAESPLDPNEVLRVAGVLERAAIAGVTEITTAFTTVAVFYDPTRVVVSGGEALFDSLETQVGSALAQLSTDESGQSASPRELIEIPVCYDDAFAPDLIDVAAHAGSARGSSPWIAGGRLALAHRWSRSRCKRFKNGLCTGFTHADLRARREPFRPIP